MKTRLVILSFLVCGALRALSAGEKAPAACGASESSATAPACCAPEKPAAAPCCTEITPDQPLTQRSLYQHDAIFTNDAGRPVKLATLRGQPVIVAMFFASCEYACPVLVSDIQRTRELLAPEVRARTKVLLVTFDTQRDTPAALRAFRERFTLDDRWELLRGADTAVQDLAMLLGVKYKLDARGQYSHSNLLTLLNAEGEIVHQHAGLMGDVSEVAKKISGLGPGI
jgi:protein SCO1/2